MKKVFLYLIVIYLTISGCSMNGLEKTSTELTDSSLETITTKAGVGSSGIKVSVPTVLGSKHAGCLNKDIKWYFSGPYCIPVGTLTVTLKDGKLYLCHKDCMANCSVNNGDEFVSLIAMHPDNSMIEFSTKLTKPYAKCMCQTSVCHYICGIREGKYTLRYIFCGAKFRDITIDIKEGQSETFDLIDYMIPIDRN